MSADVDDTVITAGAHRDPVAPVAPVAPAAPPAAPGPSIFSAFRIGSDAGVPLDMPAYSGRRPSAPRIRSTSPLRLVAVESPSSEVSATHLGIRQLGASVIVTDLRSTNGSTVMLPGSVARKLRQGESVVVSPGTLVDIGDNNIVEILPMQRVASSE